MAVNVVHIACAQYDEVARQLKAARIAARTCAERYDEVSTIANKFTSDSGEPSTLRAIYENAVTSWPDLERRACVELELAAERIARINFLLQCAEHCVYRAQYVAGVCEATVVEHVFNGYRCAAATHDVTRAMTIAPTTATSAVL